MRLGFGVALLLTVACAQSQEDTKGTVDTPASVAAPAQTQAGTSTNGESATVGRVLLVGTSLTAGYGLDDPGDAYPSVIQRTADSAGYRIVVQNGGLSGETSAGALRRIDWLLREPYDVVVIETGANDGLRGLNVDSTRANLTGIVQVVKQRLPQARVALVQMEAPPNLGPAYTKQFHDNFEQVARAEGVTLFPFLLDGVAGIGRFNQGDGIHPNPAGARIVAANVWRALAPLVDGWKQ